MSTIVNILQANVINLDHSIEKDFKLNFIHINMKKLAVVIEK